MGYPTREDFEAARAGRAPPRAGGGLTVGELVRQAHATAREKGWWGNGGTRHLPDPEDGPGRNVGEVLALVHSEVSEALEIYRARGVAGLRERWTRKDGKPEGFVVELADVLIRTADLAGALGVDLEKAVLDKLEFNRGRPFRHGGKAA